MQQKKSAKKNRQKRIRRNHSVKKIHATKKFQREKIARKIQPKNFRRNNSVKKNLYARKRIRKKKSV
jgi:hypothetical protein